jgi:hypothetical protein
MDAMISERMTRAREKDEQFLKLFNQLRERRGRNVRRRLSYKASFTLILISIAKIACLRPEDVLSVKPCASSASTLPRVPPLTRVGAEGGKPSPTVPDHGNTQVLLQVLTHEDPLPSMPSKLSAQNSSPTATTTPVLTVAVTQASQETPARISSSSITVPSAPGSPENPSQIPPSCITFPSAIPESSPELTYSHGTPPTAVVEPPKDVTLPPGDLPSHLTRPSTPRFPSPSTGTEPPLGSIDVVPMTYPGHENGTIQFSHAQSTIPSNPLPRSEEKKVPPKQGQNKTNRPTHGASSPKPSAKVTATSTLPSAQKARQSSIRVIPGAYPRTSMAVDISSWDLVSPVSPSVVVSSKMSWITRLFSWRS